MIKKLAILALAALAGAACMKEPQGDQGAEGTGEPVNVNFCLSALPMTQIEVRSVDDQITDLWVVQCVDSTVVAATYFATVDPTNVEVELKNSPGRVYFVANPVTNASLYTVGQHERDVVAASGTVAANQSSSPSLAAYPMAGKWEGTPKSGKIADEIKLYRSYAQVNLSIGANLPTGHQLTISTARLYVPKTVQYYRDPSTLESQGLYPLGALAYQTFNSDAVELTTPGQLKATVYCPETYRGKGTATVQTDKDDMEHGPNGGKELVYLYILGDYVINGATYDLLCKVYLGANNTDDYNLLRNNSYNVSVTFRGKNKADIRMEKIGSVSDVDGISSFTDYADNNENQWMLIDSRNNDGYAPWEYVAPGFDFTTNKGTGPGADGSDCPAGWRLPSLAEMRLMHAYSMDQRAGSAFQDDYPYWTSSWTGTASDPRVISMGGIDGQIVTTGKTLFPDERMNFRCVRDMPVAVSLKYPYVAGTTIVSRDASAGVLQKYLLLAGQNERLSSLAAQPDYTVSDTLNRTVPQLQVAKSDCGTGSTTYNFAQAYDACKAYSETDAPAGTWRLPTQRDLHLMFACRTSLASASGFTPMKTEDLGYVSGVQNDGKDKYLFCGETTAGESDKTTARYVRCVRAATPTTYPYLDGQYLISKDSKGGLSDADLLTDAQKQWLLTNDPYTSPIDDQGPYNKVSAKLRFSKDPCDEANCGVAPVTAATATVAARYTYDMVYAACRGYSEAGAPAGTWRLPTQAEYKQMAKAQSTQTSLFHKLGGTNVSCVRSTGDYSYVWIYSQAVATSKPTVANIPVVTTNGALAKSFVPRCVRDE